MTVYGLNLMMTLIKKRLHVISLKRKRKILVSLLSVQTRLLEVFLLHKRGQDHFLCKNKQ